MSTLPPHRDLSRELHMSSSEFALRTTSKRVTMCQLKMKLNCCGGKGYVIDTSGALTRGLVCSCVKGCQTCHGQARISLNNESTNCQTPNPKIVTKLINAAGIPSRYGMASLEKFSNFSGNGLEVQKKLLSWAAKYKRGARGLIIEGPVGVGKTYALTALTQQLAIQGVSVKFVDFFQLLSELKAAYSQNQADDAVLRPLIEVELLVIDELGKGRNSDWELSILDQLVMGRYNQNKTILASTNYSLSSSEKKQTAVFQNLDTPDAFNQSGRGFREQAFEQSLEDRVGGRIFSRLMESCYFIKLTGHDYRKHLMQSTLASGSLLK